MRQAAMAYSVMTPKRRIGHRKSSTLTRPQGRLGGAAPLARERERGCARATSYGRASTVLVLALE